MINSLFFIDVAVPIPIKQLFSYQISQAEYEFIKPGMRVIVPFGKSKTYTAIVFKKHTDIPKYKTKEILQIIDQKPIITELQLKFFQWVSAYYMNTIGEVVKHALPNPFLLESETMVERIEGSFQDAKSLSDEQFLVYEALMKFTSVSVEEINRILNKKNSISVINELVEKKLARLSEVVYEKYVPKKVKYVRLDQTYEEKPVQFVFDMIGERAEKQRKLMTSFFLLKAKNQDVMCSKLLETAGVSSSVLSSLVDKNILKEYYLTTDRISFSSTQKKETKLTKTQEETLQNIKNLFEEKQVVVLNGVPSSGKTEIYIKLIKETLESGKQAYVLLPEVSLLVQIVSRLEPFFGDVMSVYHNKYSNNERVEVWNNIRDKSEKARLVVGTQSSVFLPFTDLGLVVVDEEQDPMFGVDETKPRYNSRDCAILMANYFNAKTLLVSATPSVQSHYNTKIGKYATVSIKESYFNRKKTEIELVDIKDKNKRKLMTGSFSDSMINAIGNSLDKQKQIILYHNRRGYAPFIQCNICSTVYTCPNCDVSLTYHQQNNEVKCHYCGYRENVPKTCPACGGGSMELKGIGTEKVEEELNNLFPKARIVRLDKDSTKGKFSFEKIIHGFERHQSDIIVGTQMIAKGLDFKNVELVGIINADTILNYPDYRSQERSYQIISQLIGRCARASTEGKVLIQTRNPNHFVLKTLIESNYGSIMDKQIEDREKFMYPPCGSLIIIRFKNKNFDLINKSSLWFYNSLNLTLKDSGVVLLGPEFPDVGRIRNEYLKNIIVKFPNNISKTKIKKFILKVEDSFYSIGKYRSVKLDYFVH